KGKPGAFRDVAILNAAAALIVAGKAKSLKQGAGLAVKSIDTGEAEGRLDRLIAVSNKVEALLAGYLGENRSLQTRRDCRGQTRVPACGAGGECESLPSTT